MPVTESAKKALRRDRRRMMVNRRVRRQLKDALKEARKKPTPKTLFVTTSILDRAAKKHVIHKRKADRLKSRLTKLTKKKKKKTS